MKAIFFATTAEFRTWLTRHHRSERELWVGFYKKRTGQPSMTWPEAVAEALCFGWIDGIRKTVDSERYVNRFTPRRAGSTWSAINIRLAGELIATGRMRAAGRRAFEARRPEKSGIYSFEQQEAPRFGAAAEAAFRVNQEAWRFFESQPPGYRRTATWWVVSAKQEATRQRRLATLIEDSNHGRRLAPLRRAVKTEGP